MQNDDELLEKFVKTRLINRRNFVKLAFGTAFTASAGTAYNGIDNYITAEEEATRRHPREREIYENLESVSSNIVSAISNLDFRAGYYAPETTYVNKKPVTKSVYHPPKYPHPIDAKNNLHNAINQYRALEQKINDKTEIRRILEDVNTKLPDKQIMTVSSEVFEPEKNILRNALKQNNNIKEKYGEILYREVKDKLEWGFVESILGGSCAVLTLVLYWVFKED